MHLVVLSSGSGIACVKSLPFSRQQKLSVFKLSLTLASSSWGQIPFFSHEGSMVLEKLMDLSMKLGERISFGPVKWGGISNCDMLG